MGACNQGEKDLDFYCVSSGVDTPSDKVAASKKILHITAIMCSTNSAALYLKGFTEKSTNSESG